MTASTIFAPFRRVLAMNRGELRFRAARELRARREQLSFAARTPSWDRGAFTRIVASPISSADLERAVASARRKDWQTAHLALASHFAQRTTSFPARPVALNRLSETIRQRFPEAAHESGRRAERIQEGRYDLLGYRDLNFGAPPDWHADPVSGRRAATGFWASVPYLEPSGGDHKVIWELNRHQHWLALARAYWLNGDRQSYTTFVMQLESWMSANPPLTGVNWASMLELGFRSLSWLWALHLFANVAGANDEHPWTVDLLIGIERQLTHVEHNLSRYFSPNTHLSGEALALFVGGASLPELASSARWRALGREVLVEQATRQVHPDGGHAEQSAHYHRYSTDFYLLALLVARASGDAAAGCFEEAATRQAEFLRSIADDTGRLPLVGDDDGGQLFPVCGREPWDCRDSLAAASVVLGRDDLRVGLIPEEVHWLCGTWRDLPATDVPARPWRSRAFFDSGYMVSRTSRGDHLLFDAGRHGFLNGGHAHADALSIVLTIAERPFIVDPGTATYTMAPDVRDLFRSSAMHNTVVLNGTPPAEPRGPFHWRTTANAQPAAWLSDSRFDYLEGFHDGYAPLVHTRAVLAVHGIGWFIIDHLLGAGTARADAFWHLHPEWRVTPAGPFAVAAQQHGHTAALATLAPVEIIQGGQEPGLHSFAPVYGRIEAGTCVVAHAEGALPLMLAAFVPAQIGAGEQVAIEVLDLCSPPSDEWHGGAFRVRCGGEEYVLLSAVDRHPLERRTPATEAAHTTRGPAGRWGCAAVLTDARIALVRISPTEAGELESVAIVNGHQLHRPPAHVASSVH